MAAWQKDPELQRRYPLPGALIASLQHEMVDNLYLWARRDGIKQDADIRRHYERVIPFRKTLS